MEAKHDRAEELTATETICPGMDLRLVSFVRFTAGMETPEPRKPPSIWIRT